MISTQAERLETVMNAMGWVQKDLGKALGITQSAASKIARGLTILTAEHAQKIHDATGFEIQWLILGTGPASPSGNVVAEPETLTYASREIDELERVNGRFVMAIEEYKSHNRIESYKQVSEALQMNYTHMHNVRMGKKDVSLTLLIQAVQNGLINANYVLADRRPILLQDADNRAKEINLLKKRIEELETDKKNLQMLVDTKEDKARQTG